MVQMALKAREMMAAEGVSVRVIDMHTIKPLDGELVRKAALETGCIVTSEEHSIIGGLGGAVAEFLSENCPTPLVRHGVNDAFGRSGTANAVLEAYGPDAGGPVRQDPRSAGKETLRQHRIIAPSAFAGYFSPIHRFEKFEVHKVHLHFSNLASTKISRRMLSLNDTVLP